MDTKPLELEAESLIQHELIKYNFNLVKPTFDKEGADLIIIDDAKSKFTKTLKVQCKGRTLSGNSVRVEIPTTYVDEGFVVFIYIKQENFNNQLFVFFYDDILRWNISGNKYAISISRSQINNNELSYFLFSGDKAKLIRDTLIKSEIKKYTTVLVDLNYLNDAVAKTIEIYKDIYPDRELQKPSFNNAVKCILELYDHFKIEGKSINCHIFSYNEESPLVVTSNKIETDTGYTVKIYREEAEDIVAFEMLDHLHRIVNSENVILVSNDELFDSELELLIDKGVEVTMILYSSRNGRNIYAKNKWGDIVYPLAQAMGLERHEW